MTPNNLFITSSNTLQIKTDEAIEIYNRAGNKALQEAQKGKEPHSVDDLDLMPEIESILMQYNLLDQEEYDIIQKVIRNWDAADRRIEDQIMCAAIQNEMLNDLPIFKEKQQQQAIDYYKKITTEHILYLNQKIADKESENLLNVGQKKNNQIKIKNYQERMKVFQEALCLLAQKEDLGKTKKQFLDHIDKNKSIITQTKDSGLKKFLKGLGVAAASIFGLGFGGYFAHKHLFLFSSNAGTKVIHDISNVQKNSVKLGTSNNR